jgi:hypothetical protein
MAAVAMRSYFSTHHLWAAENCAARAAEIEVLHAGPARFEIEHRAHVLGAITMSVGFIEAMVNELFLDAMDSHGATGDGYIAPLPQRARELMRGWWSQCDDPRESLLDKCQLLLLFAARPKLDTSAQPYQDVQLLVKLRNTIVHFKPRDGGSRGPASHGEASEAQQVRRQRAHVRIGVAD